MFAVYFISVWPLSSMTIVVGPGTEAIAGEGNAAAQNIGDVGVVGIDDDEDVSGRERVGGAVAVDPLCAGHEQPGDEQSGPDAPPPAEEDGGPTADQYDADTGDDDRWRLEVRLTRVDLISAGPGRLDPHPLGAAAGPRRPPGGAVSPAPAG